MRREFIEEHNSLSSLKGLEIGPLDRPLINKARNDTNNIFYLDYMSTEDLRIKYASDCSVNTKEIVNIDFVCANGELVDSVNGEVFDYIIASHVIEHVPNLLKWLNDIEKILKPGGFAIFVIPDKRFSFDIQRPITTFGQVLEDYFLKSSNPRISAVFDHFSSAMSINGAQIWNGVIGDVELTPLASGKIAFDNAINVHQEDKYFDVHVNIFTPWSFFEIIKKAIQSDIISLKVARFKDTDIGQIEFMVELVKPKELDKEDLLLSIPVLKFETFLAPYMPQVKKLSGAIGDLTKITERLQKEIESLRLKLQHEQELNIRTKSELDFKQKTLDRKSVKIVLLVIHKLYNLFGLSKSG